MDYRLLIREAEGCSLSLSLSWELQSFFIIFLFSKAEKDGGPAHLVTLSGLITSTSSSRVIFSLCDGSSRLQKRNRRTQPQKDWSFRGYANISQGQLMIW